MGKSVAQVTREWLDRQGLSYRRAAKILTIALEGRPIPPRSISYNAVATWLKGGDIEPATIYFLANNPDAPDHVRRFARELLEASNNHA